MRQTADVAKRSVPFRDLLTFADRARYLLWTLRGRRSELRCRMRSGLALSIRPAPSGDFTIAYEVFRVRMYETGLAPEEVRRIVDVGGNVGYTCLFWCTAFPKSSVLTYEPHPEHCRILEWHLRTNEFTDRVKLIPAAAASKASRATLVDSGECSRVVTEGNSSGGSLIGIEAVDFFATVGPDPIDILKIDIEGGEYELLEDPRFDELAHRTKCVIIEWHQRAPSHHGGGWCEERLRGVGFTVVDSQPLVVDTGLVRAIR